MSYNFSPLKNSIAKTEEWLQNEYRSIHSGKATPALLDSIKVDAYGSKMPVNQLASVSIEDARTLRVTPWDASIAKSIEKAVNDADLGVTVAMGSEGMRISFPELTSERRQALGKLIRDRLEQARVSMREQRDETWSDIQEQHKSGDITEDEKYQYKEQMEKIVSGANEQFEKLAERKQKEITG